jgi:predicted secreted protein
MDFVSGAVVFILLWWWVFFMTLPFGIKTPDVVENGHATSAPENPMLQRKVMISTAIASVLFVIVYLIIDSGFISLKDL